MHQMQEMMAIMEDQIDKQNRTIWQEAIAVVIAQLQNAVLIYPNIPVTLSTPSLRKFISTLAAIGRINEG